MAPMVCRETGDTLRCLGLCPVRPFSAECFANVSCLFLAWKNITSPIRFAEIFLEQSGYCSSTACQLFLLWKGIRVFMIYLHACLIGLCTKFQVQEEPYRSRALICVGVTFLYSQRITASSAICPRGRGDTTLKFQEWSPSPNSFELAPPI